MERKNISRRRLLGMSGGIALSLAIQEGGFTKKSVEKTNTLTTRENEVVSQNHIPEIAKSGLPQYEGRYVQFLPEIASGDAPPPAPEVKKQTPYIEAKPVWSTELMSSDSAPLRNIKTSRPLVAITIDDGFAKNSLQTILDIAIAKNITYTDFMKGMQRELYPNFVKKMIESGRVEFGSHTQTHRDERNSPQPGRPPTREELIEDIYAPERFLNTFGVSSLPYQRPPGGAYSSWTIEVAGSIGYRSINWAASADGGTTTNVKSLKPGDIILMHYRDESAAQFANWIDSVRGVGLEPTCLSNVFAAEGK